VEPITRKVIKEKEEINIENKNKNTLVDVIRGKISGKISNNQSVTTVVPNMSYG
jgi:hypothetical protein